MTAYLTAVAAGWGLAGYAAYRLALKLLEKHLGGE